MSAQLRAVRPAFTPVQIESRAATAQPGRDPAACLDLALADWVPGQAVTLGQVQWAGTTPAQAFDDAVRAVDALALRHASAMLSLDPTAFDHDASWLMRVAAQARHMGVGLQLDWLGSASEPDDMDATRCAVLALREAQLATPTTTVVGRWLRSRDDADWACTQQVPLRIVKGHRPDPLRPLHDANAGFLALAQRVAGRACSVTLATNDPSLAHDALVRLLRAGTRCELELMHGAARSPSLQVARRLGVPVRCFVPWGAARRPLVVSPGARDPREAGWARETPPRALRLLGRP